MTDKAINWNGLTLTYSARVDGGEYVSPCPFCGGHDRFHVWPARDYFWCRQCDAKGDSIDFIKKRENCNYREALNRLGRSEPMRVVRTDPVKAYASLDSDLWQESAREFCRVSFDKLWGNEGKRALEYLIKRGIKESVIEQMGLGFNPAEANSVWGKTDVFMPRGIVIPWLIEGRLWRVNVRRAVELPKYMQVAGGANGLFNADMIDSDQIIVMVEGEFDCMVLQSHVKGITPVATGTTSWARENRWIAELKTAQEVILAFDVDENGAGDKAAEYWQSVLKDKALRLRPPAHDITDAWKAGVDLQAWLEPHTLYYATELTPDRLEIRRAIDDEMEKKGYVRLYDRE